MSKMKDLDIDSMNKEDYEPTDKELNDLLRNEYVKTEAEFKDKLLDEWDQTICLACYKNVKLTKAVFIDDVPYHKWCAEELGLM